MIFLDYVLSVWVSFKSVVPPWVGTLKWPSGTLRLSLSWVSLPFLLSPHVWIPVYPLPGVCLSSSLSFPLPSPLAASFLFPSEVGIQTEKCLPCQGPLPEKWNRSNYKKRITKECSVAKWRKQMFRGGFAVSGCQVKHLPYRIARCGHSSSCYRCGCFNIKYVNVCVFVSAQFSSPHHLCSPTSRVDKITDHLVARFIFTLFSEGFFFLEGALEKFIVSIYNFFY